MVAQAEKVKRGSAHDALALGMDINVVLRHMFAGLMSVDAEWRVRYVNPRAETLLRRTSAWMVGRELWDVIPDASGGPLEATARAAIQGGATERRTEHFSPTLYNWFEFWIVPAEGGIYLFFRDVTDRARQMQSEAVRESLRRILMDAPIAITITRGREHRYELTNNAARALLGGRNVEGLPARTALPEVDERLFAMLDQIYDNGNPVTLRDLEVTYDRNGDGGRYTGTFDVTYQPMREADGTVSGIVSTALETTEYAALRSEQAKRR